MSRYLIEVLHENKKEACENAVKVFQTTGSHFLTNAEWGCADDVHKAWIIVDLDSKEEALRIVPPSLRQNTKVITLHKYAFRSVEESTPYHKT
ncbi:hypothetical protein HY345_02070 [Candidatus Microgenomates bacterium]|nr:hypothetical protein [Candidatus Microgenomates bacterium]